MSTRSTWAKQNWVSRYPDKWERWDRWEHWEKAWDSWSRPRYGQKWSWNSRKERFHESHAESNGRPQDVSEISKEEGGFHKDRKDVKSEKLDVVEEAAEERTKEVLAEADEAGLPSLASLRAYYERKDLSRKKGEETSDDWQAPSSMDPSWMAWNTEMAWAFGAEASSESMFLVGVQLERSVCHVV